VCTRPSPRVEGLGTRLALSSTLAALGTLQPRAFGFLNRVDPLVSVSSISQVNILQYWTACANCW